ACWGRLCTSMVWSASRSGYATFSEVPRSPPKPPSSRAKMPEREVHSFSPSAETVSDSWMITAAAPLSWIAAIPVAGRALPGAGGPRLRAGGGGGLGRLDDHRRRARGLDRGDPRRRRRAPGGRDGAVQPDGRAAVDHLGEVDLAPREGHARRVGDIHRGGDGR